MSTYFLDTSALVKRHVAEPGHTWTEALCDDQAGSIIVIAEVSIVEVTATFCRMVRENPPRLSISDRDILISIFDVKEPIPRLLIRQQTKSCRSFNPRKQQWRRIRQRMVLIELGHYPPFGM